MKNKTNIIYFAGKYYHFVSLAILLFTAAIYSAFLNNYFSRDDFVLLDNGFKIISGQVSILQRYFWMLTDLSFAACVKTLGLDPYWFNLTNLAVHLLNVFLLGLFVSRLSGNRLTGLLTMLFFAVSSQGVESVFWISARSHSLYLAFMLLSLYLFLRWREDKVNLLFALSVLFAFFAQLAGVEGVLLPVLIAALIVLFQKDKRLSLWPVLPYVAITVLYALFHLLVKPPTVLFGYFSPQYNIIFKAGKYLLDYMDIFNSVVINLPNADIPVQAAKSLIATAVAVFCFIRIKDRFIRFGLLFTFVTMLAYMFVPTNMLLHQPSRYRYVPLAGFYMVLSSGLVYLYSKGKGKTKNIFLACFLCVFVIANTYIVILQGIDHRAIGKLHYELVNNLRDNAKGIAVNNEILFMDLNPVNGPKKITGELKYPFPVFGEKDGVMGFVPFSALLNVAFYDGKGVWKDIGSADNIINYIPGGRPILVFTEKGFVLSSADDKAINKLLKDLALTGSVPKNMSLLNRPGTCVF